MPDAYHIAAIILAAGQSKRFGRQKMLHQHQGQTLLATTLANIDSNYFYSSLIVTGADAEEITDEHKKSTATFTYNADWKLGMGHSIAAGINAIKNSPNISDAALILLGDQIYITQDELNTLAITAKNNPNKIVSAHYNGINGAPCIFPAHYFDTLASLSGDIGARQILNKTNHQCVAIEMPSAARDIDNLADLN